MGNSSEVEQIISGITWNDLNYVELQVTSPIFGQVKVNLYAEVFPAPPVVTEAMKKNLLGFLSLDASDLTTIKELLWKDCLSACEAIDYGYDEIPGKTIRESNLIGMNIQDQESAFIQSKLDRVTIKRGDKEFSNRYFSFYFDAPWEREHGCSIIVKNDKPIAAYSGDPYFGWYEKGGKFYQGEFPNS